MLHEGRENGGTKHHDNPSVGPLDNPTVQNVHSDIGTGTADFAKTWNDATSGTSSNALDAFDQGNAPEIVDDAAPQARNTTSDTTSDAGTQVADQADQANAPIDARGDKADNGATTDTAATAQDQEPTVRDCDGFKLSTYANGDSEIAYDDGRTVRTTSDGSGGENTVAAGPNGEQLYTEHTYMDNGTLVIDRQGQSPSDNFTVRRAEDGTLTQEFADGRKLVMNEDANGNNVLTSSGPSELDNFTAKQNDDGLRIDYANGGGFQDTPSGVERWGTDWTESPNSRGDDHHRFGPDLDASWKWINTSTLQRTTDSILQRMSYQRQADAIRQQL